MSWSSRGQRGGVYLVVALCALAVRFGYWSEIRGTPLDAWHTWDQSDMATSVEQARRITAGDWLGRDPYHPYHAWQTSAASEADWLRWYGPRSFHQAPLYSYALALLSPLGQHGLAAAKALQLVLGAGTCVLIALLAGRLGGAAAALIAGAIAAFYGPLYYLEAQLLREGPAVFGLLVLLLAAMRHAALPREAPLRRIAISAGAIGALIGVYALFYEIAAVLALAAAVVIGRHAASSAPRRAAVALAALAAGYVVGFAPLLARNAAVGAPLWTSSSRLGINLAYCNMSTAIDGGAVFSAPGPQLKEIMDASGGTTWGVVREVWRGYQGDRVRLFRNAAHRFRALWASSEMPDNTSFAFYRLHSAILRATFSFRWIFPAAIALGVVALVERRARGGADARATLRIRPWLAAHTSDHAALLTFTLALMLAMTVVPPQARYRLFLVPAFIIYTSLAVVASARWISARESAPALGLAGATLAATALQIWVSEPRANADDRFVDYSVAGSIYRRWGNDDAAAEYFRRRVIDP